MLADADGFADELPGLAPARSPRTHSDWGTPRVRGHGAVHLLGEGAASRTGSKETALISAERYAIKATAGTPTTFLAERRRNSACRAAAYAREHHRPTREDPFEIDGFDAIAVEFTPREAQLVELARSGLTKAEIAELLVIAIRSAETHLYRGMQTLA